MTSSLRMNQVTDDNSCLLVIDLHSCFEQLLSTKQCCSSRNINGITVR